MKALLILLSVSIFLRICLLYFGFDRFLATRIEVSTPANGALPIKEGIALINLGVSPYSGSACRIPPLALHVFSTLGPDGSVLQIVADVASGLILYFMMKRGFSGNCFQDEACIFRKREPRRICIMHIIPEN